MFHGCFIQGCSLEVVLVAQGSVQSVPRVFKLGVTDIIRIFKQNCKLVLRLFYVKDVLNNISILYYMID